MTITNPLNPAYLEALEAVAGAADRVIVDAWGLEEAFNPDSYGIGAATYHALVVASNNLDGLTPHKHCTPAGEYADLSDKLDALNNAMLALHNRVLGLERTQAEREGEL